MNELPFRTKTTHLRDEDLVLMDALFPDRRVSINLLYDDIFAEQWAFRYSHGLTDTNLESRLEELDRTGLLTIWFDRGEKFYNLTQMGGKLWSEERSPIWERFCTERYSETLNGRTLMTVVAVSPQIRDEFLDLWPSQWTQSSVRRRKATIRDYGIIPWHPFETLHVGMARYDETPESQGRTCDEVTAHQSQMLDRYYYLESVRNWWRGVRELQKFLKP